MGGGLRFNGVVVGKYIFVVVNRYLYGVFDFLYVDYWVKVVLVCYWVVINGCDDVVVFQFYGLSGRVMYYVDWYIDYVLWKFIMNLVDVEKGIF